MCGQSIAYNIYVTLANTNPLFMGFSCADDIVATTGMNNMEAAVLVDRMRYESIAKKEDFTFETVLSSEYKVNILRKAKEEG